MSFHAWHLPGFQHRELRTITLTPLGPAAAPALSAADVASITQRLLSAGEHLRERDPDDVIAAIDVVARRFLDASDPLRLEALAWLPHVTGYAPAMCALVLDRMARDWTSPQLRALLHAELPDPRILRGFVRHARGRRVTAIPPRLAFHVLAGNVPGVGVTSIVRGLLVGAPALAKSAAGEPILNALFARALSEADAGMGEAVAVTHWPGGDRELESAALAAADVVIHYGGGEALADLRARTPPHVRLLDHGPRLSLAAIARERVAAASVAKNAARAVATFDQQGCVSPHLFYVEEGGLLDAHGFAERLARALEAVGHELPRGRLTTAEAGRIQEFRADAEFRAIAGEDVRLWNGAGLAYTVLSEPDSALVGTCLNRSVRVKPLADLAGLPQVLAPQAHLLQSLALEAPPERRQLLAFSCARAGVSRITTLAALPWPAPSWHHDGRGPLRELLLFSDLETVR